MKRIQAVLAHLRWVLRDSFVSSGNALLALIVWAFFAGRQYPIVGALIACAIIVYGAFSYEESSEEDGPDGDDGEPIPEEQPKTEAKKRHLVIVKKTGTDDGR